MKKSRLFRASVLLLVISLMLSLANTTFSWFSRPESATGKNLGLSDSYATSVNNNTITFNTYESLDGGDTYGVTPINSLNPLVGIGAGDRKCYRTDIINSGTDPQSVSLFLESLTKGSNCSGISLGVNGPSKTYKHLSANGTEEKVQSDIYLQNVYVAVHAEENIENQIEKIEFWNYDNLAGNVAWNDSTGKRWYLEGHTANFEPVSQDHWGGDWQEFKLHRLTISAKATKMKLKRNDAWVDTDVQIFKDDSYKDNYIVNNTLYFYEFGGNYFVGGGYSGEHARLHTFYSSASVTAGNTIDLKATAYGSISYSSSDTSVATVDNKGKVTAKKEGTTTITVKVSGPYGSDDYLSATCDLTVNPKASNTVYDVPIATNMLVEGTTESGNGVISVYWYIKNDSETAGMTYTIPEIYVTL